MPSIHVITNLAADKFRDAALIKDLAQSIADKYSCHTESILITIQSDATIYFNGSTEACVVVQIGTIRGINRDDSHELIKIVPDFVTEAFTEVPKNRVIVSYHSIDPDMSGIGGQTLLEIAEAKANMEATSSD